MGRNAKLPMMDPSLIWGSKYPEKNDYIPEITHAIKGGWAKPMMHGKSIIDLLQLGKLEVDPLDPFQRVVRKGSVFTPTNGEHFKVVG